MKVIYNGYLSTNDFECELSNRFCLFETMATKCGTVPHLKRHLDRLIQSANALHFPTLEPRFEAQVSEAIVQFMQASIKKPIALKLSLLKQQNQTDWLLSPRQSSALPLAPKLIVSMDLAICRNVTYPHKTNQCLEHADYLKRAHTMGADEMILTDKNGFVLEGTHTSLFWLKDGILQTPSLVLGILPGITRQRLLESAPIRCEEGQYTVAEMLNAEAIYITNALIGIRRCSLLHYPLNTRKEPPPELNQFIDLFQA
jgi:branched-subunit amino acid aminotransferase/4-amino-4-deoxychorismate lyase